MQALQTDVLVVGYGPVGAAFANFLGSYGVGCVVVDKSPDILQMPRAIALDNEALRILQNAGLSEEAFAKHVITEVRMTSPVMGQFGRANTLGQINGHPKLVTFYQPDLEQALRNAAAKYDHVKVLLGHDCVSFEQSADGVTAHVTDASSNQLRISARYIVGSDGANSMVRRSIGQDFDGQTYTQDWLIIDAKQREIDAFRHVEFDCSPTHPSPHMPAPGGRERWEFMLGPGQTKEQALEDDFIRTLLNRHGDAGAVEIERKAVYRFHARCADSFQKGRAFLIGDAAHITPPFVGQGLVAGLRDAANLSWKLAAVIRQDSDAKLLDSYDLERRPHAQKMIRLARWMGQLVMPRNQWMAFVVHGIMKGLNTFRFTRRYFEDLEIKPKNAFSKGAFFTGQHTCACDLKPGEQFHQGLLKSAEGRIEWSDDVLGKGMTLVGLNVDPLKHIGSQLSDTLRRIGAAFVCIAPRGSDLGHHSLRFEDLSGTFAKSAASGAKVALIRPDRVVMSVVEPHQLEAAINQSLVVLGVKNK